MPDAASGNSLGITTKWFDIKAGGPLVLFLILGLAMNGAITYILMEQTKQMTSEHTQIKELLELVDCRMNLDVYINTAPEKSISWYKMPKELRGCMPQYMLDRENGQARPKE